LGQEKLTDTQGRKKRKRKVPVPVPGPPAVEKRGCVSPRHNIARKRKKKKELKKHRDSGIGKGGKE